MDKSLLQAGRIKHGHWCPAAVNGESDHWQAAAQPKFFKLISDLA
jgi:hypothetical protein